MRKRAPQAPPSTDEERLIVEEIRNGEGWHAIAKRFRRGGQTIRKIGAKYGLSSGVQRWSAEEEEYLRRRYADGHTARIAAELGRPTHKVWAKAKKLGLTKSDNYLRNNCRLKPGHQLGKSTQFQKGQTPPNKGLRRPGYSIGRGRMQETQFKKGERQGVATKLYKPIGSERLSKDGYLERKVNDDLPLQARWRAVHLIMWEEAHGPLPEGYAIVFKNGDKTDIRLENFEIITRAELMRRNTIHNLPPELKGAITAVAALKKAVRRKQEAHGKETGRPA